MRYSCLKGLRKALEDIKEIKTLKFAGDWDELQKNIYTYDADKI